MRALFIGRFQPLHWGHVKVIEWLLTQHKEVVVAIGSADKAMTIDNPFSVGERLEMFRRHFGENCRLIYCAIPDTGGQSTIWAAHLRHWCPPYDIVYSNNAWVELSLAFWKIPVKDHPIFGDYSATLVRFLIAKGDERWRELIPKSVADYIEEIGGVDRIKKLTNLNIERRQ